MRTFVLILAVILFPFLFQTQACADTKLETLEDYRMKGLEAQQKGQLDEATAYFTKALSLDPDRADLYNDLGVIAERMGNAYEAKRYYFEAINVNKKYLPAYSNLAVLCKREGNLAKAAEYFRRRIELGDPDDPWTKEAARELRVLGETFPEEKRWLDAYETNLLSQRSYVLQRQLKEEQDKLMANHLLMAEKYVQQAKVYEDQQMYAQAIAEYDKAIAETPESPRIPEYRRLAMIKLQKSEVEKLTHDALEKLGAGDSRSSKEIFRQILTMIPDG